MVDERVTDGTARGIVPGLGRLALEAVGRRQFRTARVEADSPPSTGNLSGLMTGRERGPRRRLMRSDLKGDADRLKRLRTLVAKLERLPASTQREWMLTEARARMVDVETGEVPRAF